MSDSCDSVAHQAPLSMGFPIQEYWSGLPYPFLGNLPSPGIEPLSPALLADSLPLSHQGSPRNPSAPTQISLLCPKLIFPPASRPLALSDLGSQTQVILNTSLASCS